MGDGGSCFRSTLNRFLSADTIVPDPTDPQSFNRYSYVRNNPLKYTDPSGHCFIFAGVDAVACYALVTLVVAELATPNQDIVADAAQGMTNLAFEIGGELDDAIDHALADRGATFSDNLNILKQELTNNATDNSLEDLTDGLERDLDNNEIGHPLGTPRNLPEPGASDQEIQEALGPDWSPPSSPNGNWHNKNTGESLHPDVNNPDHPDDPHWDYNYRGSRNNNPYGSRHGWRLRPDGTIEPKK